MGASVSGSSSWGRSWLSSWLNSWGKTADQTHSGWYRLWLTALQKKANVEHEKNKTTGSDDILGAAKEGIPNTLRAPKTTEKPKSKIRKARTTREPSSETPPAYVLPLKVEHQPTIEELISALPYPSYSVSVFDRMRDAANQEQYRKQKRQREEEALILLLAA